MQALLDTSKRSEITEVVDIQLSQNEDSVTSLAVAQSDDDSVVALTGINSSEEEQQRGNNRHLRSFRLYYPPRMPASSEGKAGTREVPRQTTPLARTSLFKTNIHKLTAGQTIDTYQRLLRLSPWERDVSSRIAAIATGLAPAGEIVLFAVTPSPQQSDVMGRIRLGNGEEAEDLDIIGLGDGKFKVAYTNGVDVFTFEISSSRRSETSPEVSCVYTMPFPRSHAKNKSRPKFRALRFLSPKSLLLLQNAPNRTGCELVVLSLPSPSALGTINSRKKLRNSVKIGLGLDVCNLGGHEKERQFVVAVSGSDQSIGLFTLEYSPEKGYCRIRPYTTLRDAHPFTMTKICFSNFQPPDPQAAADGRPQLIKLASISMGNTVVTHTLYLKPISTVSTKTRRYVLAASGRSQAWETAFSSFVALLIIAISCFLLQVFTEIRGGTPAYLGAVEWLPERVRGAIARPYMFDDALKGQYTNDVLAASTASGAPKIQTTKRSLRDLLSARRDTLSVAESAAIPAVIVVQDGGTLIFADTHNDETAVDKGAKRWEDLREEEREKWKRRLSDAGHWAIEEGEQVLKGVFFGE